ncbi:hypothetical protein Patl1_12466 [Pistacia atlantica]|uniref:Uncharacterized protein n=1 Tax=Pistacia atlantica TaxID=434234 RepID=A0ACC1AWL1_9ROSI|nr:hypothetical protein Patl1_12466 [Pistacia atlantica]
MMKWSARPMSEATKRFNVKVKPLKLDGFCADETEKTMIVETKWKGPKSVFAPFYLPSSSKLRRSRTSKKLLSKGESIVEWDDEFENICDFSVVSKDGSYGPWNVSFKVLSGDGEESQTKLTVLGKAYLNLAEVAATMESQVERKVPITPKVGGLGSEATLLVCVSFTEVRNSQDSPGLVQNSTESDKGDAFFKVMMGLTGYKKKKKGKKSQRDQASSCESDVLDGLAGNESTVTKDKANKELNSRTVSEFCPSSETQLEPQPDRKEGFFSWKRRRLNFITHKKKEEPLSKKTNDNKISDDETNHVDRQRNVDSNTPELIPDAIAFSSGCYEFCNWEDRVVVSRDGQSKLKANVFFASFDQRSEKACGEGACTALVAAIAHWLHLNQDFMPTRSELDRLITQGSSDWRKLCNNETYTNFFPDKHFDLETVLEAGLQPINVLPDKSFTGFFSPDKFECLQGAMSFDEIWDEINENAEDYQPRIYIVSWNDHFFVLKVETDAYYIIDSLGERLFEGCNQAYILKFDNSTLMYGNSEKSEEIICRGKKCCKEYIKRFLAAISLGELEEEEKKGTVSTFFLHKRLQIDFHYSSSSKYIIIIFSVNLFHFFPLLW